MGETKTEQDQFAAKIPKGEWLTVLVGKSKVRGGLSRHEFDCIKGRRVFRPAGTGKTGKDESYEGKASEKRFLSSSHLFHVTDPTPGHVNCFAASQAELGAWVASSGLFNLHHRCD